MEKQDMEHSSQQYGSEPLWDEEQSSQKNYLALQTLEVECANFETTM